MQVNEFCSEFFKRWTVKSEDAFARDATEFLHVHRGETLQFAFNRIVMDWQRKQGAPALADILASCRSVKSDNYQTAKLAEPVYDHEAFVESVFRSDIGRRCCDAMAGGDLECWLERNTGRPTEADIASMCDPAKLAAFIATGIELRDMPVRGELTEMCYRLGQAMHKKNVEFKRKYGSAAEQGRAA